MPTLFRSTCILGLGAVVGLLVSFAMPAQAAALNETQIQAIINLLSSFNADSAVVGNVEASLRGNTPTATSNTNGNSGNRGMGVAGTALCVALTRDLHKNLDDSHTNGEVTKLQQFLGISPTGFFGPMTEERLKKWQAENGVVASGTPDTTGFGFVGPRTRLAFGKWCNKNASEKIEDRKDKIASSTSHLSRPAITFNATPTSSVYAGQSTTLTWSTTNATRCVLHYGSTEENVSVSGSKVITPSQTTTYKLICSNDPGTGKDGPSADKRVIVNVLSNYGGDDSTGSNTQTSSATINQSSASAGVVTFTGTASGYSEFWVHVTKGDNLFSQGKVNLSDGSWSFTPELGLTAGTYVVSVWGYPGGVQLTSKAVTVQ